VVKAKKLKSKLEWLLVRNVVDHESVVQKIIIIIILNILHTWMVHSTALLLTVPIFSKPPDF